MTTSNLAHAATQRDDGSTRNWMMIGVMTALAFAALMSMIDIARSREASTAPTASARSIVVAQTVARLDDGVDWSRVPLAANPAPLAVAAYDR